jgi:hypothetical protein
MTVVVEGVKYFVEYRFMFDGETYFKLTGVREYLPFYEMLKLWNLGKLENAVLATRGPLEYFRCLKGPIRWAKGKPEDFVVPKK